MPTQEPELYLLCMFSFLILGSGQMVECLISPYTFFYVCLIQSFTEDRDWQIDSTGKGP